MIYPVTSAALKGHGGRNLAHNGNSTGYPEEPDTVSHLLLLFEYFGCIETFYPVLFP